MRLVFGLVLIVGLGLAGFAVYMAQSFIGQYDAALEEERQLRDSLVQAVDIYVAVAPIRYGHELTPEDVKLIKFPQETLPEGAFLTAEDLFPNDNAQPRMMTRAVEVNEPILAAKVTEPGELAGIPTFLSDGMRAFTIRVDATTGVSGFLSPGDRVDVFWSGAVNGQEFTRLIQSSVRIIAIDQSADQDRSAPAVARTVTVEVSPTQVAALAQAQQTGRLSLALVGATDNTVAGSIEVDQGTLLGIEEEVIVQQQEERICTIRQRSGDGEMVEVEIPCRD